VEVLHAVFHGALVGADLVLAALEQRQAAGVHALADLVVLDAGLHVGGLLGLDELALEGGDFLGVVELDEVHRPGGADREQRGDDQHVRIPLDHDVRVVGQPDGALRRPVALAVLEHRLVPLLVHVRARLEGAVDAHGLHRVLLGELPAQVVTGDEAAQARVEGADVVVLQIDLDEGLPVVVALVHLDLVEHVAVEVQRRARAHAGKVGGDVAAVVLEHQAVPGTDLVVVEVQAGVVREVRRAQQLAFEVVGPAVQRAHHRLLGVAAAAQHHGLAMAADVGDQLQPLGRAHQGPAFAFLGQRVVVAHLRHGQLVPEVARARLEDQSLFIAEQRLVEIGGN
jgi:hypothetical protein